METAVGKDLFRCPRCGSTCYDILDDGITNIRQIRCNDCFATTYLVNGDEEVTIANVDIQDETKLVCPKCGSENGYVYGLPPTESSPSKTMFRCYDCQGISQLFKPTDLDEAIEEYDERVDKFAESVHYDRMHILDAIKEASDKLEDKYPECREKLMAATKLDEAYLWASSLTDEDLCNIIEFQDYRDNR